MFEDRVVIVTGAGGGIGRAVAERFLRMGARVVGSDLQEPILDEAMRTVDDAADRYVATAGDISDPDDVVRIVGAAPERWGALHILVNVAAVTGAGLDSDTNIVDTPLDVWDRIIGVNLRGTMLMCRAAVPAILSSGGGAIVNVSSEAARWASPRTFAYSASKAGVNSLTRHIAAAFGRQGIRCNTVMPGLVLGTYASSTFSSFTPEALAEREQQSLVGRLGRPEDIAAMVTFLASDEESGYVNGQAFSCAGGAAA